jgi:N-acyl-D-amino-acid deacylase
MPRSLFLLLLPVAVLAQAQTPVYDLVIAGGRIVDGTGNPWYYGDLGITGDRIVAIGNLGAAQAKTRLDAKGLVVAPGFIDIHSHGNSGILRAPAAENYIRQGVTTMVEGNDGGGPLPVGPHLAKLAGSRFAVNYATFVGHGSIRRMVVGLENRRATPQEIQKMKALTSQAMFEGAFGLSTGLFYVPGNYATTEEVIELAKAAGALGGMHISHMRNEAEGVLDSVRETIRIGEEGGLPTQVTHHKISGVPNWGKSVETLRLVEEARARGVDVTIDQYPYTASSTGTAALFPQWAQAGGAKSLLERLEAPETRAKIKAAIVEALVNSRGGGDPKNVVMASCGFDGSLAGRNLAELTAARGAPVNMENAAETAIEIQKKGGCSAIYHSMAEEDLERILRSPYTMVASDGGIPAFGQAAPHPRNYGAFARVLGRYVREHKVISLESAIHKMSGFPAARLKLMDRGLLAVGMKADVAALDPATVADRAGFGKPHQYAAGLRHVLVNGTVVLRDGAMTGALPGRVLYGPSYRAN